MTPDEWRAGGDHFDFRHHRVFYRRGGKGSPLVLVHGFPTAGWDFHELWPELTKHFDVIVPDLLGYGFSAKPMPHAYRIVEQADLIEQLMRHLVIASPYHLFLHDYGVSIGQELLARDTALLSATFLNGGLLPEAHRARLVQKLLAGRLGPWLVRAMSRSTFGKQMKAMFGAATPPSEQELDAMWQLVTHDEGLRVIPALLDYLRERKANRERWVGALLRTRVPVRLINGLADPVSGAHLVDALQKLKPSLDVVRLPGVGHYPQLEAPAAVLAAFRAFVPPDSGFIFGSR